jgi:hypothetical protein
MEDLMTIRVKLQRDRTFKHVIGWQRERWWVNYSTGGYFAIFKNDDGTWSHWGNQHRRFSLQREAIHEYLQAEAEDRLRSAAQYRKLKLKEQRYVVQIVPPGRRVAARPLAASQKCRRSASRGRRAN